MAAVFVVTVTSVVWLLSARTQSGSKGEGRGSTSCLHSLAHLRNPESPGTPGIWGANSGAHLPADTQASQRPETVPSQAAGNRMNVRT